VVKLRIRPGLVQGVVAFLLIVAGVALLCIPAALIVAGVLLTLDRITS
jgi:hypothetical protein